jgi:hypothetical protein
MVIDIFEKIEADILQKWNRTHAASAAASAASAAASARCDIIQQLRDGVISVWKQDLYITDKPQFYHFIIKISGVWENETENEYGLTYKCI